MPTEKKDYEVCLFVVATKIQYLNFIFVLQLLRISCILHETIFDSIDIKTRWGAKYNMTTIEYTPDRIDSKKWYIWVPKYFPNLLISQQCLKRAYSLVPDEVNLSGGLKCIIME